MAGRTLYDKLWDSHLVKQNTDGSSLIYIDRHVIHEVTSPQAFEGLRIAGRAPWRLDTNIATPDHNISTDKSERDAGVAGMSDEVSRIQVQTLDDNCDLYGIKEFKINEMGQGIVHVMGPELGATMPGMTVVCGDSHTATHGALACLAHGIGTSEVEHVLATQTLAQRKAKNFRVNVVGDAPDYITAKDIALAVIGEIGTAGGTGYVLEYAGPAIEALTMEGRMTLCNMSIEAGARAGLIAPDEKTFEYLKDRPRAPKGADWDAAVAYWQTLRSDSDAVFDREITIDAANLPPLVTWGTSPQDVISINGRVPDPAAIDNEARRKATERALAYMGLEADMPVQSIEIDRVFIGSCTNSRIEDLRAAAKVVEGKKVSDRVNAMVVPGSGLVKKQAEEEGLDKVFLDAGFEWRDPGCSMCLAMNADKLSPQERCASTSNRNFEGRQGREGRTHLVSPAMAAAAAIRGHFVDIRDF